MAGPGFMQLADQRPHQYQCLSSLDVIDERRGTRSLTGHQDELLKNVDLVDRVAEQQEEPSFGVGHRREAFLRKVDLMHFRHWPALRMG